MSRSGRNVASLVISSEQSQKRDSEDKRRGEILVEAGGTGPSRPQAGFESKIRIAGLPLFSPLPSLVDLLESGVQVSSEIPVRIMRLHLTQVRDVANVVALAIVLAVLVGHFLAGNL